MAFPVSKKHRNNLLIRIDYFLEQLKMTGRSSLPILFLPVWVFPLQDHFLWAS